MRSNEHNDFDKLRGKVAQIKKTLTSGSTKQVTAAPLRRRASELVHDYFQTDRFRLVESGLDNETLGSLDKWMQDLLELSQKNALRSKYRQTIRGIEQEMNGIEVAALRLLSPRAATQHGTLDGKDDRVRETLHALVPSAATSYEQACLDLRDPERRSFRGSAAELREALREILDHLAPDKDVMDKSGFKLEVGLNKPTMKQKTRFILSSRGMSRSAANAPEDAVAVVEERVGAFARSVYTRSSLSTHRGGSRQEANQIKAYVDLVLAELLELA